jgi:hypothetical protein
MKTKTTLMLGAMVTAFFAAGAMANSLNAYPQLQKLQATAQKNPGVTQQALTAAAQKNPGVTQKAHAGQGCPCHPRALCVSTELVDVQQSLNGAGSHSTSSTTRLWCCD